MMSTPTAASPLSAADRARKKAEARRSRILAKSAVRLDVVSGLIPGASIREEKKHDDAPPGAPVDDNDVDAADASTPREIVVVSPVVASAAAMAMAECGEAEAASSSPESPSAAVAEAEAEARGARRMAAMRRRRYQSKGVGRPVEEDGASGGGGGCRIGSGLPARTERTR